MKKCKYPNCGKPATKAWALVPLCEAHHDAIKKETMEYYGKPFRTHIPYDERNCYLQIAHLIPWSRWTKL